MLASMVFSTVFVKLEFDDGKDGPYLGLEKIDSRREHGERGENKNISETITFTQRHSGKRGLDRVGA